MRAVVPKSFAKLIVGAILLPAVNFHWPVNEPVVPGAPVVRAVTVTVVAVIDVAKIEGDVTD